MRRTSVSSEARHALCNPARWHVLLHRRLRQRKVLRRARIVGGEVADQVPDLRRIVFGAEHLEVAQDGREVLEIGDLDRCDGNLLAELDHDPFVDRARRQHVLFAVARKHAVGARRRLVGCKDLGTALGRSIVELARWYVFERQNRFDSKASSEDWRR